jgi:hypothetical protein
MIHLPNPLAKNNSSVSHLFFAIILSEQYASSALWGAVDGQVQILERSEDHAWQEEETCINAVDQSLQELGKESEHISQTLFALPSEWVDADGIVTSKKQLFQKMTKDLSLEPIGFVVTTEAMAQYLTQSSPQLHIFILEVGIASMTLALVKGGQITQTVKVGRSGESVSDLREALAHLKEQSFPAKIEVYSPSLSQEELNEVQQQLIGFEWKEAYPFLHPPVIEVFETLPFVDVVIKTGGMALAVGKGLVSADNSGGAVAATPVVAEEIPQTEEILPENNEASNLETVSAAEMGFATSSLEGRVVPAVLDSEQPELAIEPSAQPLAASMPVKETAVEAGMPVQVSKYTSEHVIPHRSSRKPFHLGTFLKEHLLYILAGVGAGILILGLITFIAAQSMLRAKVSLTFHNQNVVKDITLTLDPQVPTSDPDRLLLKANVITQNQEGEKTADTTGTKIIGDKATGTVTVYNYTSSQKTFAAGTKLNGDKVSFTFDKEVTVASASSTLDSSNNMVTKPGTQEAAASATAMGEESNIAANTNLTIESFSKETYLAVTKAAFTGGSSREIQAVSVKDRDQLLAALKKELLDKAIQESKTSSSNGQYQIPTNRVKVVSATYNAEVGKETNTLTLKLVLQVELLEYRAEDLQPLARELLSKEVQSGYKLVETPPQILSVPASTSTTSAKVALQTNLSSIAEPDVDVDDFRSQIAGKSEQEALQVLRANPAVAVAQIEFIPKLLGMIFHTLPSQPANIEIVKE